MPNQILYGVGNAVFRDFSDATKIVALSKLKDLNVETSSSEETVMGGDSPYPLAKFPKDKTIKVSCSNAYFDIKQVGMTQGVDPAVGQVVFTEMESYVIPTGGIVTVKYTPLDTGLVVDGYTLPAKGTTAGATGTATQDTTDAKKFYFNTADVGKEVVFVYDRNSSASAQTLAVTKDAMAKPFKFVHRIPVYDDNNTVVGQGMLIVYKCRANNAFTFGLQPQTAFAPKLELEALDPKRPDGKLWDFVVDTGTVA